VLTELFQYTDVGSGGGGWGVGRAKVVEVIRESN